MSRRRRFLLVAIVLWALAVAVATTRSPGPLPTAPARCQDRTSIEATLFLLGDAGAPIAPAAGGDPVAAEPVLRALASEGAEAVARVEPEHAAAVFLGDNAYPSGTPVAVGPERDQAERRLDAQLAALRGAGLRAWFVPGNHDWAGGRGADGWARVRRQGELLAASGIATLAPAGGCPGPVRARLGEHLELVFLDTAWWLYPGDKPRDPDSPCAEDSEAEVSAALGAALDEIAAAGRHAIVLAHHPLATGGPHGLRFRWTDHVFPLRTIDARLALPLPIIGSAYPLARLFGASSQDLSHPSNQRLRAALEETMATAPPLVYAAGHEHSLQLLRGSAARWLVVSGAGSSRNITFVRAVEDMLYGEAAPGFARLDVRRGGGVELGFFTVRGTEPPSESFSACLRE